MAEVSNVTDENYESEIAEGFVLVDFFADWCGPCKMLAPMLDDLADEYEGRVKILKANVDECPKFAQSCKVRSVPTLIMFKGGIVQSQTIGAKGLSELRRFVNDAIAG